VKTGNGGKGIVKNYMKLRADKASSCAKDERNIGSMMRRRTKLNAKARSGLPFWYLLTLL
jgi:hypothetical protein